ncbi:PilW family protein [Acinetobacter towneri]|uniref:PilW family protein n=1 Tax=Acinetobacter towneri TaxID=202956 RepID=A0ABX7TFM5_9GAMM|nr:PilW family protein [Acinetobacter towneri]QTD59333.1 PilW family protein [Acinetobacter towneri]QTD62098.1 PilW family protein [Acinetobacter towneri]
MIKNPKQLGFTLIELMISLVLGLLVSAIAINIFFLGQRSSTVQQGMMSLQNSTLFNLGSVINSIRIANLNSSKPFIDDTVLYGGIVLSRNNISNNVKEDGSLNFTINDNLLTKSTIGPSNLDGQSSDQLVVQYKVSTANQYDCEGQEVTANDYVVERYFLREDDKPRNDPNKALVLACKATRYTESTAKTNTTLSGLTGGGEIIVPRVDHFSVRLGVAFDGANPNCTGTSVTTGEGESRVTTNYEPDTKLDCFSYMDVDDYMGLSGRKPQIVSVQLGLLVRSSDSTGVNQYFDEDRVFEVLGAKGKLIADANNHLYLRSVVNQTIAIRNGFGIE